MPFSRPQAREQETSETPTKSTKGMKKNDHSTLRGPQWLVWAPFFDPKDPPEKFYVGRLFALFFPGNEAHKL